jgi:hypothetical protein
MLLQNMIEDVWIYVTFFLGAAVLAGAFFLGAAAFFAYFYNIIIMSAQHKREEDRLLPFWEWRLSLPWHRQPKMENVN